MTADPSPAFASLRYEVDDAIATITLDRPAALNALTVPLKLERLAAFRAVARDRAVRAVVLTGAGRAFCAGQDLKERLEADAVPLEVEVRERYNPIIAAMRRLDQPIVGAINGVAAGAGASLAFACDVRVAAKEASFVLAFGRIGLVPDEALAAEARAMAATLAGLAPRALALTKHAIEASWSVDLETALRDEAYRQGIAGATADHAEGLAAFVEKRAPRFTGE